MPSDIARTVPARFDRRVTRVDRANAASRATQRSDVMTIASRSKYLPRVTQ
jgi:hypothetical protein